MTYILFRRRSFLSRILHAPRMFLSHYHAFRVFGSSIWRALIVAALLTSCLFDRRREES